MDTTATTEGFAYTTPQYTYSTADIERGLFYGVERRGDHTLRQPLSGGGNAVSIGGSYFIIDEIATAPWAPLGPNAGLLRLVS
jgi:hypothetical protein